jgi:hypothetical protein
MSDSPGPAIRGPRGDTPLARNGRCMSIDAYPGSVSQAPPGTPGTTHPAMHDGRSPLDWRFRRPLVVTVLVTVFLARPDFQWRAVANLTASRADKSPATDAI